MNKPSEYTPDRIAKLNPNEIFVFGSNEGGFHGAGAAKLAMDKFGAIWGTGDGPQGQCYGISTKNPKIRTLPLAKIAIKISRFLRYAKLAPNSKFLVTQIGCGLAGYNPSDIGPLFFNDGDIPFNVILPKEFWAFVK